MTNGSATSHASDESRPRIGIDFPLAPFEQRIMADPDVLGLMYNGSFGRGEPDRWSDIDVKIWLREDVLARPQLLEHYMSYFGELQFVFSLGMFGNGYVGPDWQSVDVGLMAKSDFEAGSYYHRAVIVKDTDDFLASIVAASPPPTPELSRESAQKIVEEAIHILGHVTMHNLRGSAYQAMGNLSEQADNLYCMLARLRGFEPYNVRVVERFLPPDELALLYAAWPAGPDREAIRRAVRGLWAWTRYVWAEAEQTLGGSLGITLDQEALLPALERHYGTIA
jgi:hypothetical protein